MKEFVIILKYIRKFWREFLLNVLFSILFVFFSFFSLAMVAPFLSLLFGLAEPVLVKPELSLSSDVIIQWFYYYVTQIQLEYSDFGALVFISILFIVFTFFSALSRYLLMYFITPLRNGLVESLRNDLYAKTLQLPVPFFSEQRKGDLISRMTIDAVEIEWSMLLPIQNLIKDPINIIVFLVALFAINPGLVVFVLIVMPPTAYIINKLGKSLKRNAQKGQLTIGSLIAVIEETITGMRVIKSFNMQDAVQRKFAAINKEYTRLMNKITRKKELADPLTEIIVVIAAIFVIWYGGQLVLNKELSATELILFIVLFFRLIPPAKSVANAVFNFQKGKASLHRLMEIINAEDTLQEIENPVRKSDFTDNIQFRNVTFTYPSNPDKIVLDNINLEIKKGETIALVGPSGAGKTTIADLIPRFYDVNDGKVLIDGVNVKNLKLKDLRALSAIVSQHCILFNDTVFNNIAFGIDNVSEEDVINAAKIANAHEFIEKMPQGYQTNIGDSGVKLSGGQRQRLSIARAVLKKAPIIILDEATSALDNESEKLVQHALNELMKEHTSLVIAHRLSTIQHADKILVVDHGKIIETGDHQALMSNQESLYKKLVEMQSFV